jgi:hypothetical protein
MVKERNIHCPGTRTASNRILILRDDNCLEMLLHLVKVAPTALDIHIFRYLVQGLSILIAGPVQRDLETHSTNRQMNASRSDLKLGSCSTLRGKAWCLHFHSSRSITQLDSTL